MTARPNDTHHASAQPRVVTVTDWVARMGIGAPPLGSMQCCANCMAPVTVTGDTSMVTRPERSDAIVVCDGCARVVPRQGELRRSAPEPGSPPLAASVPAEDTAKGEGAQPAVSGDNRDGRLFFDVDMQAALNIHSQPDVQRLMNRLHEVVSAVAYLHTTEEFKPPALLPDVLDYVTGRNDRSSLLILHKVATAPAPSDSGSQPGGERDDPRGGPQS